MNPDKIICSCYKVSKGDVARAVDDGAASFKEVKKATKAEIAQIKALFLEHFKDARTELVFSNDFELLIAVMLSAQCTDKRVNLITPELFA